MIVNKFTTRLRHALLAIFSVTILSVPLAFGQDKTPSAATATQAPALTLAINSFDKLIPDVMYIMKAAGMQQQTGFVTLFVNQYSQGVDRTRAIGVSVHLQPGGAMPKVFVMLPIKDLDTFFAANSNMLSKNEISKDHYELTVNTTSPFHAVYENQWLFVTQNEEDLPLHPASPSTLTDPLTSRYDIGVNVNMASVPADAKEQIIANLEQGFKSGIERQTSGKSPEEAAAARKQGEMGIEQIKEMINDTDQLLVGLGTDKNAKNIFLDFGSKFKSGTKLAQQVNSLASLQSVLGSVIQSTDPIQVTYRSKLTKEEIGRLNTNFDMQLSQLNSTIKTSINNPKAREIVTKIATVLMESLKGTVADGEVDSAYAVNFTNGINLISVGRAANASEVENKVIGLFKEYQSEALAPKISGQPQDYAGMKLYTGTWKVPAEQDFNDLRKIVGETVPFTFAFGKGHTGFALGVNAEKNLKAAIDRIQKAQPAAAAPFNLSIELLPILQYASPLVSDPRANSVLNAVIAKVTQFESNDKLKVESKTVKDGIMVRLILEEGLLQSIGTAAMAASAPPPRGR